MNTLDGIGFYTMREARCRGSSATSCMSRCEMILLEGCNFRCPYCRGLSDQIYGIRRKKILSLEEIQRNIDYWCEGLPLEALRFSGGEPTLHPDIVAAVAYAKTQGIQRIAISTNGSASWDLYQQLLDAGVNDFSVSLDGCCSEVVESMSGGIKGCFSVISENIRKLSERTYVTVGVVLLPESIQRTLDTVRYADSLGVSDIRLISAAQWDQPIPALGQLEEALLAKYPILRYRAKNFERGITVRGLTDEDSPRCGIMWDDSVIAGDYHFPCVIYMREKGQPVGKVGPNMRRERMEWAEAHDARKDPICRKNCLDVCRDYNNRHAVYHT